VCSVAAGFDLPSLGVLGRAESLAPHNATVVDMEVYTCTLEELKLSTESNAAEANKKRKQ
jgi:hypothetical protein